MGEVGRGRRSSKTRERAGLEPTGPSLLEGRRDFPQRPGLLSLAGELWSVSHALEFVPSGEGPSHSHTSMLARGCLGHKPQALATLSAGKAAPAASRRAAGPPGERLASRLLTANGTEAGSHSEIVTRNRTGLGQAASNKTVFMPQLSLYLCDQGQIIEPYWQFSRL